MNGTEYMKLAREHRGGGGNRRNKIDMGEGRGWGEEDNKDKGTKNEKHTNNSKKERGQEETK